MPLIQDVNICQKLWLLTLDQPFDAGALAALKERYDRARRQDATYQKLYKRSHPMHIQTFWGSADDMGDAIVEAAEDAQALLGNLGRDEVVSVQAQSFVDRWGWDDTDGGGHTCFHVITVTYD